MSNEPLIGNDSLIYLGETTDFCYYKEWWPLFIAFSAAACVFLIIRLFQKNLKVVSTACCLALFIEGIYGAIQCQGEMFRAIDLYVNIGVGSILILILLIQELISRKAKRENKRIT